MNAGVNLDSGVADFDGSGKINCGYGASIGDIGNAFTLIASIKGTFRDWVNTHIAGTVNGYHMNTSGNPTPTLPAVPGYAYAGVKTDENATVQQGTINPVWDGEWRHLALVYNGAQVLYYYEGLDDSVDYKAHFGSVADTTEVTISPFTIGNDHWGKPVLGQMREVKVYNRALTPLEIATDKGIVPELPLAISPTNNAINIDIKVALEWTAGQGSTSHEVYFGTDFNDVNDGTGTLISTQAVTKYPAIGTLNLAFNTTYYWRINELPTNISGGTWKFTTGGFIGLDGFESYISGPDLRSTWIPEGYAVPNYIYLSKISTSGRANSGSQSMRNNYYNSAGDGYCGAHIDFGAGLQDLTENGLAAISLYFSGKTTNTVTANDALYITLEDNDGEFATVYRDDDVNDAKLTTWKLWAVDIQDFVAVNAILNLSEIKKISIGVGKGGTGGSGDVYFDDVRFEISKCVPEVGPVGDLTDDCLVTYEDLRLLLEDYLESEGLHSSSAPTDDPVGQWNFDNDTADDANQLDPANGTLWGGAYIDNGELVLDTNTAGVDCGNSVPKLNNITGNYTLTAFVKTTSSGEFMSVATKGEANSYRVSMTASGRIFAPLRTDAIAPDPNFAVASGGNALNDGEWYHLAIVYDGSALHAYVNGGINFHYQASISGLVTTGTSPFEIGNNYPGQGFVGRIDDVRLYNYALTAEELKYLTSSKISLVIPLDNPERELTGDGKINLKDIAKLGIEWLDEVLWP